MWEGSTRAKQRAFKQASLWAEGLSSSNSRPVKPLTSHLRPVQDANAPTDGHRRALVVSCDHNDSDACLPAQLYRGGHFNPWIQHAHASNESQIGLIFNKVGRVLKVHFFSSQGLSWVARARHRSVSLPLPHSRMTDMTFCLTPGVIGTLVLPTRMWVHLSMTPSGAPSQTFCSSKSGSVCLVYNKLTLIFYHVKLQSKFLFINCLMTELQAFARSILETLQFGIKYIHLLY